MNTHDWHALVALGTDGGQPLADGDRLGLGVHLRWSIRSELGFPVDGYEVWRRRHRAPEWVCFDMEEAGPPAGGATQWTWLGFTLDASSGVVALDEFGCGKLPALHLPPTPDIGDRTLAVRGPRDFVAVRATGSGEAPLVEVFSIEGGDATLIARRRATATEGGWQVEIWSEGIAGVRFSAPELFLCTLCFGIAITESGWDRLHEEPILLPVVPRGSSNEAARIHAPSETRAQARARLSDTLDASARDHLADGFAREPRELVEMLLRGGRESRLPAQPDAAAGARTPPTLAMSTATVLALHAIDPAVARMLGLYWHDPVETGRWDYKVVARHGDVRWPGRRVTFDGLDVAPLATPTFTRDGLTFVGNQGLEIVAPGSEGTPQRALRVQSPRAGTVAGVQIDRPVPAVTLRLAFNPLGQPFFGTVTAWRGAAAVASAGFAAGQVTVEAAIGIDAVTWDGATLDLVEVVLYQTAGTVGDLVAYAWNQTPRRPVPVRALSLDAAAGSTEPTRVRSDGTVDLHTGVAGIDWTDPIDVPDAARPLRVLVARSDRGDGDVPEGSGPFEVRNAARPAVAHARQRLTGEAWPGPDVPHRWTERDLAPGWYAWRVRGIDAFGRLGAWSTEQVCEVRPVAAPPPPDAVTAHYLAAADPFLRDEHRTLVEADGDGLLVEWTWPAERRLRAPRVESAGEFRVYVRRGDPNMLAGTATAVTDRGDRSRLSTTLDWSGRAKALVGERLRLGKSSFEIVDHGTGRDIAIEVMHLTAPTARPVPGPFTIDISERGHARTDLTDPLSFEQRVHVEAAGPIPALTTRVTGVSEAEAVATVTLADRFPSTSRELAAPLLASRGMVWPVVSASSGSAQVVVRTVVQADGTTCLPAPGDRCTVWPGARYRAWLPGLRLRPAVRDALALGLVAVCAADGDPRIADDPAWEDPGRGSLGGRPGREGPLSRVARLRVPHRAPPRAVEPVLPPEVEGDIPADVAEPADWYGRARYALDIPAVTGATGYRVLRAATAALFARDRAQRQAGAAPYAGGPFDDDGASEAWLAEHHASVSVSGLTADPATQTPDVQAAVRAAWRAWMAWYYPQLLNREVMALAEIDGNQDAFAPAHPGTIAGRTFRDTLDGRGLGRFVYRVRSVDASGNVGALSGAFPVVEVRDVTAPKTPTVLSAVAFDNVASLAWLANAEADLAGYRLWRAEAAAALDDVRRLPPLAEIAAVPGAPQVAWTDTGLPGLRTYHYRVAAFDATGNVSAPTRVVAIRVPDATPPAPPDWERADWVRLDEAGVEYAYTDPVAVQGGYAPAIALAWRAAEGALTATVERRLAAERTWRAVAIGLAPRREVGPQRGRFAWLDRSADPRVDVEYRIRLTDEAGNTNLRRANPITVGAPRPLR